MIPATDCYLVVGLTGGTEAGARRSDVERGVEEGGDVSKGLGGRLVVVSI